MSEMSCKTCRRWAAGWCLAQQLGTSRDEVCNAWELSRVVEWEDENEKLQSRIAELEAEKCVLEDQQREVKNILIDKNLHIDSLYEEGYKLQKRIAELEAAQRWIPVSERLPEDLQPTVIITKGGMTGIVRYLELYGREGFGSWSEDVTHWMPLPQPPEVQQ